MATLDRSLIGEVLVDFRRTWPQLALTDLLARGLGVVLLVPTTSLLLKVFLSQADNGVLTDTDIAVFLLHPLGLLAGLLFGVVSLGMLFAETGTLMVIGFGAADGRRVTWLDALRYVGSHARQVLTLAGRFLATVALVAAPFLLAIAWIYRHFLSAHDINFYLADRPPEFRTALVWAAAVVVLLSLALLRLFAGWILGLPLVLFGGVPGSKALKSSTQALGGHQWTVVLFVGTWVGLFLAFHSTVTFVLSLLGDLLVPDFGGNMTWFALGLGLTLLITALAQLTLAFASTTIFALLLVRIYRRVAEPGRFDPPVADRGSLGTTAHLAVPGKWLLLGAAGTVAAVIFGGLQLSRTLDEQEDVLVIAHRGASAAAPENTMASFEQAIVERADFIELDVQEDADGVVIVAHDSDFMKVAGNGMKVWESTAESRRDLDIGSYYDSSFADQRVATLAEVLRLARGKIGVVIELKYYGHDDRLEERVVSVVEAAEMQDDIKLMSLKRASLDKAAKLRPDWPTGLLNTVAIGDLTRLDLDFLALNAAAAHMSTIRRARENGMQVYVWTINDPIQMSVMMSRGVDGIITDNPATVRQVIEIRDTLGPFGRLVLWIAGETGFLRNDAVVSQAEDA